MYPVVLCLTIAAGHKYDHRHPRFKLTPIEPHNYNSPSPPYTLLDLRVSVPQPPSTVTNALVRRGVPPQAPEESPPPQYPPPPTLLVSLRQDTRLPPPSPNPSRHINPKPSPQLKPPPSPNPSRHHITPRPPANMCKSPPPPSH
ncbi:hypothetical protein F511_46622 [Dorcoceras hygrometricum]|uniref:Uncharacterized protein n=1 Tax=Dorcoceras hygrometricum TaxID=472368 RepID=A0A2Z6ZZW3_9LAMI|nr:hypothetical protein F511_46622 [Dorcoceras hygrometricum]